MDYVFITEVTLACEMDKNKQIFTLMINYSVSLNKRNDNHENAWVSGLI